MAGLTLVFAGAVCAGCGRHKQASATNGSGSAGSDDPAELWRVTRMTADTVIVVRGAKVAALDPSGRILSHPAITPELAEDAPMNGRLMAWLDGANVDELHLVDLNSGRERWHATTAHRAEWLVFGTRSIAVLTVEGVELHHLDDGSLGYHHAGPKMVDGVYEDGTFAFIDDAGMIETVDEARDVQRWAFDGKASSLGEHNSVHLAAGEVLALDWQIDLATGKARPRPDPKPTVDAVMTSELARTNERTKLVAELAGNSTHRMYLVDARGGVIWTSSEWKRFLERSLDFESNGVAITKPESGAVVLESQSPPLRILVGFDNKTGHVRYDRPLGKDDELVGGDDDCIALLDRSSGVKLQCLDDKTGAVRWEHAMTGHARAWHVMRHWIVASGSPATLEALDNTGKLLWTTTLPDTQVTESSEADLVAHLGTDAAQMWELGPSYFILREARDVSLVDLGTGALAKVTP